MLYLGIDPGKTGGWALINKLEKPILTERFVSFRRLLDLLNQHALSFSNSLVFPVLEEVGAMAKHGVKQGAVSTCTFCTNFGGWLATLELMGLEAHLTRPQIWQKEILGGALQVKTGDTKPAALRFAQKHWPDLNLQKKDDGIVDALCIALYAKRLHTNQIGQTLYNVS